MNIYSLLSITFSLLFQFLWILDVATSQTVECVSNEAGPTNEGEFVSAINLTRASAVCIDPHPVLLSCGYRTLLQTAQIVRGNTIRYIPQDDGVFDVGDPQRCITESENSTALGAFVYAQCCKFPDSAMITCDQYRSFSSNSANCRPNNTDLPGGSLFSCTSRNQNGGGVGTGGAFPFSLSTAFTGQTYPLTIDPAELNVCTAETLSNAPQAVQAEMQCCNITNGNDNLVCEYIVAGEVARTVTVGCGGGQFIAGCSGWTAANVIKYVPYGTFLSDVGRIL